jgi:hypothetical protein
MSQKPRPKPRRLFRHCPLSPLLLAGIEAVTAGDPKLHLALLEAVSAINDEQFLAALVRLTAFRRTTLLLAWRDAVFSLQRGDPCDLCRKAPARHARLVGIGTGQAAWLVPAREGEQGFVGFPTVCSTCFRLPAAELVDRLTAQHPGMLQRAAEAVKRPALIGLKIGQAGDLGRRPILESCSDCAEVIWIDQSEVDRIAPEVPLHLCGACARKLFEAGQMEAVPLFELGGLS